MSEFEEFPEATRHPCDIAFSAGCAIGMISGVLLSWFVWGFM